MQHARLGWIGVGKMGAPLSARLLEAGFDLSVVDADPARVAALIARGAKSCPDAATLVRSTDVVFSMVPNDDALLAIVSGEAGLARAIGPGQIFVDLSTVSPVRSAQVAELLARPARSMSGRRSRGAPRTRLPVPSRSTARGPRRHLPRCVLHWSGWETD